MSIIGIFIIGFIIGLILVILELINQRIHPEHYEFESDIYKKIWRLEI
jgi:uncharacterized membrane protein